VAIIACRFVSLTWNRFKIAQKTKTTVSLAEIVAAESGFLNKKIIWPRAEERF
jgi:hypothetical protein